MQHQVQIAFARDHDALAQPAESHHGFPLDGGNRRQRGAQQEGVQQTHAQQPTVRNPRGQALQVDSKIGQFGHSAQS
jgi:hypothetical protein